MDGADLLTFDVPHLTPEGTISYYSLAAYQSQLHGDRRIVLLLHGLGCQARDFDQLLAGWLVGMSAAVAAAEMSTEQLIMGSDPSEFHERAFWDRFYATWRQGV